MTSCEWSFRFFLDRHVVAFRFAMNSSLRRHGRCVRCLAALPQASKQQDFRPREKGDFLSMNNTMKKILTTMNDTSQNPFFRCCFKRIQQKRLWRNLHSSPWGLEVRGVDGYWRGNTQLQGSVLYIYRVNESLRRGPAIDSHKRMILHFCLSTSNWNESA